MILLIDNYDSFTYNLYNAIAELGINVKVVRNDQISLETIKALSPQGIVLSPGPGRPEDAGLCDAGLCIEIIRTFSGDKPILGVCLGHQAIACSFGAKVVKAREIVHGKSTLIFHNRALIYKKMPLPFEAGRYHSLVIEKKSLPAILQIGAETPDGIIMGIKHAHHPTYGVQFHPESILSLHGKTIIKNFMSICKEIESC
jgi:anthranilate synthase component II